MSRKTGSNRQATLRTTFVNWLLVGLQFEDKNFNSANTRRSRRRRIGAASSYELLEVRQLMASDVGSVAVDAEEGLKHLAALSPTHTYYVEGQSKGLVKHPSRFAIDLQVDNTPDAELASLGLTFVRKLNSDFSIYDFDLARASTSNENSWRDSSLIDEIAPVFVAQESSSEAVVLDELIVELADGITAEVFFADNADFTGYRSLPGTSDQYVATVAAGLGEAALAVAKLLHSDSRIAWIEPNFYQNWQKFFTPNDPRFANQWHLHNTGQSGGTIDADSDLPEAWDVIQGGSVNYTIGIIDDGVVTNHPDLTVWVNPGEVANNGIDDDSNGWIDDVNGWNFVSNNNQSSNTSSLDMHGTSVAGVAAAKGNNSLGVAGASYGSKVLSARIFEGNSVADDASIASALYYTAGRKANGNGTWKAADVLNNSWGGGASATVINNALTWGTTLGRQGKGTPIFVAAGNEFGAVSEPALQSLNIPGVFAVGAINNKAEKSDYSNFGAAVDLVTPSNDTRSGYLAIDTTDRPGSAGYDPSDYTGTGANGFGGTSSATPFASGIAALVLARADQLGVTLTPAQLRSYLRSNTDIVGSSAYSITTGRNNNMGWGRLNAASGVSNLNKAEISVISTTAELFTGGTSVNFGSAQLGATVDVTLRVRNQGTASLNLSSLTVGSGPFLVQSGIGSSTLALGAATTFTIRFQPTAEGIANGTMTIGSNDADEALFTINLTGTGTTTGGGTGGVLLAWDVNGQTAYGTQNLSASSVASGLANSLGLTRGSGVTTINTAAADAWGGNGWASTSSAGVTGNQFVSFGFTVSAGQTASISSVDLNYRRSGTGAGNGFWQYQINAGSWTDIGDFANAFSSSASAGAAMSQLSLSGISGLQNLASGTSVNLRVVPYGATSTGGTWYVYDLTGDDLIVSGSVQATSGTNSAPTDIALSSTLIAENAGADSTIGTLSSTDANVGNTFNYSLVTGTGSTDNSAFAISGHTLKANASFDFETKNSYSIRVRTTDQGGLFFEKAFTINVTNVNEAPTLTTSGGSSSFSGAGPVFVDTGVVIADVDSTTFTGAIISISGNFTSSQDVLGFVNANGITGSYNASTGVLSLSGSATVANYQAALRSVTYNNTSSSPNTTARVVSFQVNDGGATNNLSNVATKSVTVASSSNQPVSVSSVTQTSTGFTIQFSRPIDPAQINLYDATTNSLGETDVTLVGATSGAVRGSVVFNAINTALTFIKTGMGTLAPDTYTLTLRSAATGFVDVGGNLLRDIGGANAGNYVSTFTVSAPASNAVTLSIPDFARGFSQTVNVPNTSIGLPITISNANNISGVDVTINYNPALLTITGVSTPMAGASAVINTSDPGTARIQVSSPGAFASVDGAATILNLIASVPANAPYAFKGIISFASILVRDTNLAVVPSVADNAVHVAAFFDDLNADQRYDSADTILVQRLGVRLNSGTTSYQTLDPFVIGDALNDQSFDSADTITAQRLGVNIPVPSVPTLPAGAGSNVIYGADPQLSIGVVTASSAAVGTNVFVPINLLVTESSGITLAGMDFAVSFDPNRFQVTAGGVTIASSTQNGLIWETDASGNSNPNLAGGAFSLAPSNIDNVAGTIRMQASSPDGTVTLPQGTSGALLRIRFTIKAGAAAGSSSINLMQNIGTTNTRLRDNNLVALTLIPAPTNASNDTIDGSITIPGAVNSAPTALSLSPTVLAENAGANAPVGTFTTTDPNAGDTFTYTLVSGTGSTDNADFNIIGNSLRANASFDFETKSSYTVRVRTTDQGGLFFEQSFPITVTNVNEFSGSLSLGALTASSAAVGTNVFVPINLLVTESSGITLAGMDFAISFDPSRFQVTAGGVSVASDTQNGLIWETNANGNANPRLAGGAFSLAPSNIDNVAGTIRIQASSPDGTITLPQGTSGALLRVRFTIRAGAAAGLSVINLMQNVGTTNTRLRDNNLVALTLVPPPTNGNSDTIDGSITIPTAVNSAPTDVTLSSTTIAENLGANATVGTFTTTDPDAGNTHTYSLVAGTGSTDNAAFTISGNTLTANASFDFETKNSYSVRVRTTDQGGLTFEKVFTIAVTNANEAPLDIALSSTSIAENTGANAAVGNFSTTDPDAANTFTYALVAGTGSTDNAAFTITGNTLTANAGFNFETKSSYSIRVRTTDQGGLQIEKAITVSIIDLPEMIDGPIIGNGTAQRSIVKQIVVTFDSVVTIGTGAFTVTKRGVGGGVVPTNASGSTNGQGQFVVTITFSGALTRGGALSDGYYELTVDGTKLTRAGLGLDINQDGTGGDSLLIGDDEADKFFALYGDTNGDGLVGIAEFGQFRSAFGKTSSDPGYNANFDFEGDGVLSLSDFEQFRSRFGKSKLAF